MKKKLLFLLFVGFVNFSFAQINFDNEFHDLNDNQVPENWELIINNPEAGIEDGRLNAFPTDANGSLKREGQMPTNTVELILEWDGNVEYSYWGMETKVSILTNNGISFAFMDGMYEHGAGMNNKVIIFGNNQGNQEILFEETYELTYTDYHYNVKINNSILIFSAIDNQNSTSLFNIEIAVPYSEFDLMNITEIEYITTTTTSATAWLDNIEITIEAPSQIYFVNEFHDLNDNQVPENWELIINNPEVAIEGGKLNAFPTDASGSLKREGQMPTNTAELILEWDGNVEYSYWGMETKVKILTNNGISFTFMDGMYEHGAGLNNKVIIFGKNQGNQEILFEETYELAYTDYHYKVEINNSILTFSAIDNQNSTILFNIEIAVPYSGFDLMNTVEIEYIATTTTSATAWLDNIEITLEDNVGIENSINSNNYIAVFPNPTTDFIKLSNALVGYHKYKINNLLGEIVKEGSCEQKVEVSSLKNGYYIILIYDKQGKMIAFSKFIKKT